MKVVVVVIDGGRAGQRLTFDKARSVRFGRHPDNDVAFDAQIDRDASSRHAELRLALSGYRLFDLGSANGTFVDGKRISTDGIGVGDAIEAKFGTSGPRCRIEVIDEARAVVPATLHHEPGVFTEPDAVVVAPTKPDRPPAPAVAAPASRKFGANTVAGIVDEALRRAQGGQHRRALTVGLALALVAGGVGAAVALTLRARPAAMRRELSALVDAQRSANDDERARLQLKIDQLAKKLSHGVEIPRANHAAIFLVTSRGTDGTDGFCTAFAATKRRLLTNAHCVQLAEELHHRGSKIEIVPNGGGAAMAIVAWRKAPGFHASSTRIGTDVGWLQVDEDLPQQVQLASPQIVENIAAGDSMSTYGFPGRLADSTAPEATYVAGVIGRVTTLDGRPGSPGDQQLLQHSAFTSAGTSGSPLFDAEGRVIGINAGGYVDDSAAGRPLPGYNFGMRIDLAVALLNEDPK